MTLVAAAALGYALVSGGIQLSEQLWPTTTPITWQTEAKRLLLIFVPVGIVGWLANRFFGTGAINWHGSPSWSAPLALAAGIGGLAAAAAISSQFGVIATAPDTMRAAMAAMVAGSLAIFVQAAAEEIFFRGWLQSVLTKYWGAWASILVTALVFTVLHPAGLTRAPLSLFGIFLFGVVAGLLVQRTGGLLAAIMLHFGWNWSEQILLGLDPNPGVGVFGAIYDLDRTGAQIWAGAGDGLNASASISIVLLAMILLTFLVGNAKTPATAAARTAPAKPADDGKTILAFQADAGPAPAAAPEPAKAPAVEGAVHSTSSIKVGGLRVTDDATSHVGRVRSINEDSMLASIELGLWAVADGMGGHEYGERASSAIIDSLRQIGNPASLEDLIASASDAIKKANGEIYSEAQAQNLRMGSTVVALGLVDRRYAVLWAGDSRAYLIRDGQLSRLTRDHTQVQQLVDKGVLKPEEAEGHPMSHVLARAIGVMANVEVDCVTDELQPDDIFLLCSDGLYSMVRESEMTAILSEGSLADATESLIRASLDRGAPDNVTAVAVSAREATLLTFGKEG